MENLGQPHPVGFAPDAFFNFIHPPGGPGVDGGIYIAERPLIRRNLPVGMHVPFSDQ